MIISSAQDKEACQDISNNRKVETPEIPADINIKKEPKSLTK
jgi:hypothetical protein